jgi:ParB-like chromosome segregation protein Spo0J
LFPGEYSTARSARVNIDELKKNIISLGVQDRISKINEIKIALSECSPFSEEPVDCVQWVRSEDVVANDYNPNAVAVTEMKLLETSILQDGYTQPIVVWKNGDKFEVVDGFHRSRVGKESDTVRTRVMGYLPVVVINDQSLDRGNRIAATIRHNRARGKHRVGSMSDIIMELKKRRWSDERIASELGMHEDEIIKLSQIAGLSELYKDREFSKAWDPDEEKIQ